MNEFNHYLSFFRSQRLNKAYKLQGSLVFQGLPIKIEQRVGSIRHWKDKDGNEGQTKMHTRYGYISKTLGADGLRENTGDAVDVYVSDINPKSDKVFVIHQKFPDTGEYDEDKCMLGFNTKKQAIAEYFRHLDSKEFFDSCEEFTIEEFKQALKELRGHKITHEALGKAFDLIESKDYILDSQGNPVLSKANSLNTILHYSGFEAIPVSSEDSLILLNKSSQLDITKAVLKGDKFVQAQLKFRRIRKQ